MCGHGTWKLTAGLLLIALLAAAALAGPAGASTRVRSDDRVTLCHRVGGPQYVQITVAPSAALNAHARNHELDIIPPFRSGNENFPGKNWNADGQGTWANGCVAPPSPQAIVVSVSCVEPAAGGTYTARFGYKSENTVQRSVPIGADNTASPGGPDRGQPTTFLPGRVETAFKITGVPIGQEATWTVRFAGKTSTATATSASTPCETAPPPTARLGLFATCITTNADGSYDATFGYQNDASAELAVPIGEDNKVSPGGPDRGQPSVFPPGRTERAFTVRGVPKDKLVTWTVTKGGSDRVAIASSTFTVQCAEPPIEARGIGISVTCVTAVANGTYDATFGYENANKGTIVVPIGLGNRFTPEPGDRGQLTEFKPGKDSAAFTVKGIPEDQVLTWTLAFQGTRTATASAAFPAKCETTPPPETTRLAVFLTCVTSGPNGTYAATFGYENPSTDTLVRPLGVKNRFTPAPENRGQPTTFLAGNTNRAFTVEGIAADDRPEWQVAAGDGTVSKARATPDAPNCVVQPPPGPDIDVDKDADVAVTRVGSLVGFTLTARNSGTASSWGVRLRDPQTAGARLVRVISGLRSVTCSGRRDVVCRLPRFAPGASFTVRIFLMPERAGTLINDGELGGSGTPSRPVDRDRDRAKVRVEPRRSAARPRFTG